MHVITEEVKGEAGMRRMEQVQNNRAGGGKREHTNKLQCMSRLEQWVQHEGACGKVGSMREQDVKPTMESLLHGPPFILHPRLSSSNSAVPSKINLVPFSGVHCIQDHKQSRV